MQNDYRLIQNKYGNVYRYVGDVLPPWSDDEKPPDGWHWYTEKVKPGARVEGDYIPSENEND